MGNTEKVLAVKFILGEVWEINQDSGGRWLASWIPAEGSGKPADYGVKVIGSYISIVEEGPPATLAIPAGYI